jgi:hypothetical protein
MHYTHGKLLQWAIIIKIQLSMVLRYTIDIIISSLKSNLFLPWHSWNIAHLALHNNHSFTNSNNISISPFIQFRGSRCRGRTVVGFTTTCAISAYHHQHYEFEPRSDDVRFGFVWLILLSINFNNISVISWRSVLLVEEIAELWENHRPIASH